MEKVSHAQNGEDVRAWRALQTVETPFYLEVGAHHAQDLSISASFRQMGWRGCLVEADPELAARLQDARPDDNVIAAAASDQSGEVTFYRVEESGLSTTVPHWAGAAAAQGFHVQELTVPSVRLCDVLDGLGIAEVHFLSLDVEGAEAAVLRGLDLSRWRPWVLCVEAVAPGTKTPTWVAWEDQVLLADYRFAASDGVNRWYVAGEHADLAALVAQPYSVLDRSFDGWLLADELTLASSEARSLEFATELAALQETLTATCDALSAERQKARELTAQLAQDALLKERLAEAEERVRLDGAVRRSLRIRVGVAEQHLSAARVDVERGRHQRDLLGKREQQASDQAAAALVRLARSRHDLARARARASDAEAQAAHLSAEREQLIQAAAGAQGEVESLRAALATTDASIGQMQAEIDVARREYQRVATEVASWHDHVREIATELEISRTQLASIYASKHWNAVQPYRAASGSWRRFVAALRGVFQLLSGREQAPVQAVPVWVPPVPSWSDFGSMTRVGTSPVPGSAPTPPRMQLSASGVVDEGEWMRYLGELYANVIHRPMQQGAAPPPDCTLFVVILPGPGSLDETTAAIASMVAGAEYPIRAVIAKDATLESVLGCLREASDEDFALLLKAGDAPRPELHLALRVFEVFESDVAVVDGYSRTDDGVVPLLLPGIDPIHAEWCDYWRGRALARIGALRRPVHRRSEPPTAAVRTLLQGHAAATCHVPVPLLCLVAEDLDARAFVRRRAPSSNGRKTVSAVICTHENVHMLRRLVADLETEPALLDIIIVSNNTTSPEGLEVLSELDRRPAVTVLRFDEPFNFSRQCNLGARFASGEHLFFVNDDVLPTGRGWLTALQEWLVEDPRIVVGPMLLYPSGRVQHVGMYFGVRGSAGHFRRDVDPRSWFFESALHAPTEVSCLTGAALLVHRQLFEELNGFDPVLASYLQDVDLSLRFTRSGARLVCDPRVAMIHMESASVEKTLSNPVAQHTRQLEYAYFSKRWRGDLRRDRRLHPLLEKDDESGRSLMAELSS